MSNNSLTGACKYVSIDKSADRGVIVAGLQVVEVRLIIEVVAPVAEGVNVLQVAVGGEDIAPGIVAVAGDQGVGAALVDPEHVALEVLDEVVVGPALADAVVPQGEGLGPSYLFG